MKILSCLTLFFVLIILSSQKAGYCKNDAIVFLQPSKPLTIARGAAAELLVTVKIKDGYHLQANLVKNQFLVPTSLKMNAGENIIIDAPIYPAGHPFKLAGSQEVLLTYEKNLVIRLPVAVKSFAKPGVEHISGELYFQPCNSQRCLFPSSIPVAISIKIILPSQF